MTMTEVGQAVMEAIVIDNLLRGLDGILSRGKIRAKYHREKCVISKKATLNRDSGLQLTVRKGDLFKLQIEKEVLVKVTEIISKRNGKVYAMEITALNSRNFEPIIDEQCVDENQAVRVCILPEELLKHKKYKMTEVEEALYGKR